MIMQSWMRYPYGLYSFAASAGALYVYRPSKKRRILNRAIEQLEESGRMLAQLLLVTPSDFSSRINYM